MYTDQIRSFIQGRLQAYDPSIDISDGSPSSVNVVEPIIARLGSYPFGIDTVSFIKQRILEVYPDINANNEFEDLFVNPLVIILDQYQQELGRIAIGQSLANATLMTEQEVDDLGANWFADRNLGGFSSGTVRVYYSSPQAVTYDISTAITSKSGLVFYPITSAEISSGQMLFNRDGFEFFIDIQVRAENPGEQYNINAGEISSINGIKTPLRIININGFSGGIDRETNEAFIARIRQSGTETSLNTKRGASVRTQQLFPNLRSIQIIGAGEEGMDRDILTGTGEGFLHINSFAIVYGNWIFIDVTSGYEDLGNGSLTIEPGDSIRFQQDPAVDPSRKIYKSKITKVLFKNLDKYLVQISEDLGFSLVVAGYISVFKPGYISISKVPEGTGNVSVPDNKVHLGGHTDIYVSPSDNTVESAIIKNVIDENPILKLIAGQTTAGDNKFSTIAPDPINLFNSDVKIGDILSIETGAQIGTYRIIDVDSFIRVDKNFTVTETSIRARIIRNMNMSLNGPKNIKVPFSTPTNDLRTTTGSNLFRLDSTNLITYGVVVGDVFEILSGPDIGIYSITGFDTFLGGNGPLLNRTATTSGSLLSYRVYSLQDGVNFPMVRIENIELLDSSNQPTGIKIPYGDLVDVRVACDFETDTPPSTVIDKLGFLIPNTFINNYLTLTNDPATPGPGVDARYTQLIASHDGIIRKVTANGANPITTIEINVPPFLYDAKKTSVLTLTSKKDNKFLGDPSGNPQTSPMAESRVNDILTINDGPNLGNYLLRDLRVLELWGVTTPGHFNVAVGQVDGEFPMDPVSTILFFIELGILTGSGVTSFSVADFMKIFQYSTDWDNSSGFIESVLIPRLETTLAYYGFTTTTQEVRALVNSLVMFSYSVGDAPTGELICYTKEPVTVNLSLDPGTHFTAIGTNRKVRLSTNLESGQVLPLSEVSTPPSTWLRNGTMNYPASTIFNLIDTPTFVSRGVRDGDVLEYYPAINDFPARNLQESSYMCITQAGSNTVQLLFPSTRLHQTALTAGQLLFIDSGPDQGSYTISEVLSDSHPTYIVKVDRSLTYSTLGLPSTILYDATASIGFNSIGHLSFPGTVTTNDYVTVFSATSAIIKTNGKDESFLGTFPITYVGSGQITVSRTSFFPNNATIGVIVHPAPTNPPTPTSGGGTEISNQYVRFRLYDTNSSKKTISINWAATPNPIDPTSTDQIELSSSLTTSGSITSFTHKSPFRILRSNFYTIPSTKLALNRRVGLYYFTIPVIALGLTQDYKFSENTAFEITDNFLIEGYKIEVENETLSYSNKETSSLILPPSILPNGVSLSDDNRINISGQNIKITYDYSGVVDDIQRFYDSPLDRITSNNPLVRHFLPCYTYLEIYYSSGSTTDVVAQEIIKFINNINPDVNELRVDALNRILQNRGASKITQPIELVGLTHGLDRKIRVMRSFDSIGGVGNFPVFKGVQKMVGYIAGPDVSSLTTMPDSEFTYLKKN